MALHVLERVERDRAYADLTLHAELGRGDLPRRERALATEMSYGTLRLRGRIDAALEQVLDRPLEKAEPTVRNLLRLGAYQLLFLRSVPDAAAVDETVKLARRVGRARAAGFVNAVLRQLARRRGNLRIPSLREDPVSHVEQYGSVPRWLAERWVEELGAEEAAALALAQVEAPPRTVRVSPGADKEALAKRLRARPCGRAPDGLTQLQRDPLRDAAFAAGEITVQDEASQLVALLLGAEPGDTVVDCCAAPGTKAVQLAQQVGPRGEVIALELHAGRIPLIGRSARRLGLDNLRILQRDAAQGFDLKGRLRFRRILIDAPCSGLGVLRRNVDARWRLSPEDVPRAADTQLRLLASATRYLEPGGVMVYSVCTMTPEETSGVIARFLAEHPKVRIDDPRPCLPAKAWDLVDADQALRTWPQRHGCDGFFAVRLVATP